ncbi:hypothetical protein NIES4075_31240 [Tolypothrix sp. NIES-4075]|uniref:hypothetical protein n=1 Tax=Tolypothrix sp. NIES-4075 TaxID=2005459 RepID=UPI000B5C8D3D|nr:hypothetical protein [Tolypothrix sp. NIES-4075]GAX42124.1 hypothetical protein NIES4075_31240 [Tolypothrix sp. NIES-4075]
MLAELPEEQQRQSLIIGLFIWVLVVSLVTCNQWNKKLPGVGLPLIYLFNLSMNHLLGAMLYAFPWYAPKSAYNLSQGASLTNTSVGFQQSVYGIIGFGLGSIIFAPWMLKIFKPNSHVKVLKQFNLNLPKTYIVLGLLFYFVLSPINRIPSLAAVTSFGLTVFSVGLCLGCWKAWCMNDKKSFSLWLLTACSMPVFSLLNGGFLSFGIAGFSIVLMFVLSFYRPRWKLLIIGLLAIVLGLSFFVTYFRDRDQLRAKIGSGAGIESRIEQVWQMVSTFEFFNPWEQKHLEIIEGRLNINTIVGLGVNRISYGTADFVYGETLEQAALATVPRILWPNKPVSAGSGDMATRFAGLKLEGTTSIGIGNVAEFYFNFGTLGVVLGLFSFGTLLRMIDIVAVHKLFYADWLGFANWFLPGCALINPASSLVETGGNIAAVIVLVYFINKVYLPNLMRK